MSFTALLVCLLLVLLPQLGSGQDMLRTPRLQMTQQLRIDPEKENLIAITRLFVRSDGVMALLQARDFKILFYDSTGKRSGSYGKSGEGPG